MILRKATTAYLLILTSLTLIPVSVYLTTPTAHAMIPFTSYQDLQEFVRTSSCASPTPSLYNRGGLTTSPTPAGFATAQSNSGSSQTPAHSETNQQVSGVDELDTVKNDGQYIYTVTNNTVAIVQAYPAPGAVLVSKVTVNGTLQGIFIVDISNHASPVLTTRVEVNGTLAGARLIGNYVYLVATQPVFCYGEILLPEQIINGQVVKATPVQVYHSDIIDQGYSFTTILGFDATQSSPSTTAKIYLIGTTSTIYVSLHDIYLTQPVWSQSQETIIHRISIDGLAITYMATGAVPGHILNQFSMDEYNGYLRIATTNCCSQSGGPVPLAYTPVTQQETNVYVLDKSLHTAGRLEGLSPGEQIYSARFMGDKAYLVTYKRTDPLFVIGLQDPSRPKVLG